MRKSVLFVMLFICSTFMTQVFGSNPMVDPATYSSKFGYNLTNQWAYTNVLGNYVTASDLLGAAGSVRGMAVKEGKMLFSSRNSGNQILIVDGATGAKLTPVNLASNVFTYMGKNKAGDADSLWTTPLPCNDIQIDDAGNVLVSNLSTSNTARFQIWKIDMATGNGTALVDQAMITDFPLSEAGTRFDAFGVWGDVTGDAVIMAASADPDVVEVYKWTVTGGVVQTPVSIILDNFTKGTTLTDKANLGSAPRVLPLDNNYFYVDGNNIMPTLMDKDGNVVDGFHNKYSALTDSVTSTGNKWTMNVGHNGVKEFQIGNDYFIIMSATNTAGVPPSSFRVFKFADAGKAFTGIDVMWTFPQAGMGGQSNSYRTGMPVVEVNGNTANIYVYTGDNGYAMYTMSAPTGVNNARVSQVNAVLRGNVITMSEEVKSVTIYAVNGQKVNTAFNVSEIAAPSQKGIYLVNITDKIGTAKVQKIVVR
ncbi:MAG: T9SS type A sorting domain-containing protein [Paludibacteraceae bacterium]